MIWTERDIMSRLNSPFLVNLVHAFQDDKEMYFVMPFMQGGDLRFHLGKLGCLSEEDGRFYSAEIILGLESMHSLNVRRERGRGRGRQGRGRVEGACGGRVVANQCAAPIRSPVSDPCSLRALPRVVFPFPFPSPFRSSTAT